MKQLICDGCVELARAILDQLTPGFEAEGECFKCGQKLIVDGDTRKVYLKDEKVSNC